MTSPGFGHRGAFCGDPEPLFDTRLGEASAGPWPEEEDVRLEPTQSIDTAAFSSLGMRCPARSDKPASPTPRHGMAVGTVERGRAVAFERCEPTPEGWVDFAGEEADVLDPADGFNADAFCAADGFDADAFCAADRFDPDALDFVEGLDADVAVADCAERAPGAPVGCAEDGTSGVAGADAATNPMETAALSSVGVEADVRPC